MSLELALRHQEIRLFGWIPLGVLVKMWAMQTLQQFLMRMPKCWLYLSHSLLMRLHHTLCLFSTHVIFLSIWFSHLHIICILRAPFLPTSCALKFLHLIHREVFPMVTSPHQMMMKLMMMILELWILMTTVPKLVALNFFEISTDASTYFALVYVTYGLNCILHRHKFCRVGSFKWMSPGVARWNPGIFVETWKYYTDWSYC